MLYRMTSPSVIAQSEKQYIIDNGGIQLLDCISYNAIVGHSHPQIKATSHSQLNKLSTSHGFLHDTYSSYVKQLISTFPKALSVCYLLNSRSEANDLALRLARTYTEKYDVVVFEGSYHGSFAALLEISHKIFKKNQNLNSNHALVIPLPDLFRMSYILENDDLLCNEYIPKIIDSFNDAKENGQKISCFMSQMINVNTGVIVPPKNYFKLLFKCGRDIGGVCIVDETQTGLGRLGNCMWSFQYFDVVPDIVTIGEVLGNGFPMAAVITTNEIAGHLGEYYSTYGGNPVACSIGRTVLNIIENEHLQASCKEVGRTLTKGFEELKKEFCFIGDIRGMGLCIGIEIVEDKISKLPNEQGAKAILHSLKVDHHILVGIQGLNGNVLTLTPPMCFNQQNARSVISAFKDVLSSITLTTESSFNLSMATTKTSTLRSCSAEKLEESKKTDDEDAPSAKKFKFEEKRYDAVD